MVQVQLQQTKLYSGYTCIVKIVVRLCNKAILYLCKNVNNYFLVQHVKTFFIIAQLVVTNINFYKLLDGFLSQAHN